MKNICNGKRFISISMVNSKRVVLIGAGNVATHLGVGLQEAGWEVVQVYSRSFASASEISFLLIMRFILHSSSP